MAISLIFTFFLPFAAFMIIIACINYMNLATARSVRRAKEVGIRKVMGSQRKQLIYQFLSESMILGIVAMLLSLFICIFSYYPPLVTLQTNPSHLATFCNPTFY